MIRFENVTFAYERGKPVIQSVSFAIHRGETVGLIGANGAGKSTVMKILEGIPLTANTLCETYLELNKQYFGPEMVSDPLIANEWCRIPHFYYNFYVYQYATSFAASVAIAHRILEQGEAAVKPYLEFLSGGCTKDPVSLLKIAGVDLSTSEPIDEALEVFGRAIDELEIIQKEMTGERT